MSFVPPPLGDTPLPREPRPAELESVAPGFYAELVDSWDDLRSTLERMNKELADSIRLFQVASDGLLYRFDAARNLWLSVPRPLLLFNHEAPPVAGALKVGTVVTGAGGSGLGPGSPALRPGVFFVWGAHWVGGAPAAMTLDLRVNGAAAHTWTAAGGETGFVETVPTSVAAFAQGANLASQIAGNTGPAATDLVVWVEVAWSLSP